VQQVRELLQLLLEYPGSCGIATPLQGCCGVQQPDELVLVDHPPTGVLDCLDYAAVA
jgi:hypothetical protein